jgi:mono/diheme cytochrome c family protein
MRAAPEFSWTIVVVLTAMLGVACGPARPSEPTVGPTALGPRERQGQFAFMHTCNPCHPQAGGGLGAPLDTKPFAIPQLRAKVRGLAPGNMPKFSDTEVSDDDIEAIGSYLSAIRKKT